MAKELPYFKFYTSEWTNGDITLEDYNLQGFFVNVCAYYWSKDCDLSLVNLQKKFRNDNNLIEYLIANKLIKVAGDNVVISFLNEQFESKEVQKISNRINGIKGGRPKKEETENKPNGLFFANPNETQTITQTKPKHNQYKVKESKVDNIYNPSDARSIDPIKFITFFNSIRNTKYQATAKIKQCLKARCKEYSKEDIIIAIKNAHLDDYHKSTNFKYLTPEFILRTDKIEKFLNAPKEQSNEPKGYSPQLTN
jgi:hypothetical protein